MEQHQRRGTMKLAPILVVFGIVVFAFVAAVLVYGLPHRGASKNVNADPTANWKTYSNPTAGLALKYPPDWTPAETSNENAVIAFRSPRYKETERSKLQGEIEILKVARKNDQESLAYYGRRSDRFTRFIYGPMPIKVDGRDAARFANIISQKMPLMPRAEVDVDMGAYFLTFVLDNIAGNYQNDIKTLDLMWQTARLTQV